MFSSWPASALVDGVKIGSGSSADSFKPGGQLDAADGLRFLVFLPAAARKDSRARCIRWPAASAFFTIIERRASLSGERLQIFRQRIVRAGEQMVRHERGEFLKPEMRNLREHLALARNAVGHDDVEGGNAVAGDEAESGRRGRRLRGPCRTEFFDAGQIELQNRFVPCANY